MLNPTGGDEGNVYITTMHNKPMLPKHFIKCMYQNRSSCGSTFPSCALSPALLAVQLPQARLQRCVRFDAAAAAALPSHLGARLRR